MTKKYDWDNYLIIEQDFIEAKKYLSFERAANLEADSPFLQNEIVLLGSKVEIAMKKLIQCRNKDNSFCPGNISDYKRMLLVIFPDIESYESLLIHSDLKITPFKGWSQKQLTWWEAYSKIKHGSSRIPKLEHALNLLSAYQILLFLIHYEDRCDEEYIFYTFDEMPKLLELQFQWELHPFGPIGFGFPREQIKECNNADRIKAEIENIMSERKAKKQGADSVGVVV